MITLCTLTFSLKQQREALHPGLMAHILINYSEIFNDWPLKCKLYKCLCKMSRLLATMLTVQAVMILNLSADRVRTVISF